MREGGVGFEIDELGSELSIGVSMSLGFPLSTFKKPFIWVNKTKGKLLEVGFNCLIRSQYIYA